MSTPSKSGIDALPRPTESVLLLIDHQPLQYLHSHEPTRVFGNVLDLADAAAAVRVPTVLTTMVEEYGGRTLQPLQDLLPSQKPIDRTSLNAWDDERVVDAVKATGRRNLVVTGLYTETCVLLPALRAAAEGYDVHVVTDACAGVTAEAHDMAVRHMVRAGIVPIERRAVGNKWLRHRGRNQAPPQAASSGAVR
ncbi:isochorismatase family protein [Streptomyces tailanensis]|uniref:isochorismatase family protein n=1 Tax=Streptomyces tailanensis TaxID=2569858 RepID=UPI00122E067D|nr:isochorismatase family protein [Streptomyces tailanensis]